MYYEDEKKKAYEIMHEILDNIPNYSQEDPNYELKVFTYIYVKLAFMIEYDHMAANIIDSNLGGYDRDRAEECIIDPASDLRALVRGKGVCCAFARILETILDMVDIKVKYISSGTHAWNQVCLNGIWYNCDLTCDYAFIRSGLKCDFFLKSNKDCRGVQKYGLPINGEKCLQSISDEEQEILITEALNYIKSLKKSTPNIPIFLQKIFSFFNKKKGGKSL